METIKIKLTKSDILKEILGIMSQSEVPRKIVFHCQGNIPLLADIRALKRIQKTAEEEKKIVEFICPQKFIREILSKFNFTTYKNCPQDYLELEEKDLIEVYTPPQLPVKNIALKVAEKNSDKTELQPRTEKLETTFEKHKIHNPGRQKTSRSKIFFVFVFILMILAGLLLWITPKAKIVLKPRLSPLPVIQNIIITLPEAEVDEIDQDLPQVKGVFISTQVQGKENYVASGRKYDITNAHGKVTLFNETDKPKFLVPSRLSTEDGLIFRFKKEVTIPAKKNGQPGQKVVEIWADEYDERGNPIGYRGNIIAGTKLFFPALRKELREIYYAKANKGPLVGGSTLTHYYVQEEDEQKSADFLREILQTQAIEKLKKENQARSFREKKQFVLLENKDLFVSGFKNFKFPKDLIGQEQETFEVSGELELSGIVFDQDEVKKILLKKLNDILDDRQQLIELDDNSIEYDLLNKEDFAEKRYIKLSVKAVGVKSIDLTVNTKDMLEWVNNLKKQIAGKSREQARSILINVPEIEQVLEIKIDPFWSDDLPKIFNRIKFEINKMI